MGKKHKANIKTAGEPASTATQITEPLSFWAHAWGPLVLLFSAVAVVYYPSLSNDFVAFDDDKSIWYNPHLKNPSLAGIFGEQLVGMYVPITSLAYLLVYQVFGEQASAFHAFSLLIHLLNVVLVFKLMQRILPLPWAPFFIALMFGLHPMLAEPVSWVSALSTLLFSCFYLLGLHVFWTHLETKAERHYWMTLGVFLLAGLSKSAAATFPVALVVLDWWKNGRLSWNIIWNKWPFWLLSASLIVLTFLTRSAEGHDIGGSTASFNAIDRLFMISQTLFFYPFKLLIPLNYSILYPFVKMKQSWPIPYYAALPALGVLTWWVIKNWHKQRDIILGLGLYIAPLFLMLPVVSVGTAEMRNDRYAYLPSLGIFWLLILLAARIKPEALRYVLLSLFCAFLAFQTYHQSLVWKDGTALFQNCVDKTPDAALCQCNLGYSELLSLDFENSVLHYSKALELDPTYVEAYNGRGQAYLNLKKIPQALSDFTKAIDAGIITPKLFFNRGKCYALQNKYQEALPDLTRSLELEPKSPETWYFRAFANEKTNQAENALTDYSKAIELNPQYVEALVNRGLLYYLRQDYKASIDDNSRALNIAASGIKPMILVNRANGYLQSGELEKALDDVNNALAINGTYPRAYQSRAAIYQKMGRSDLASADLLKAGQ